MIAICPAGEEHLARGLRRGELEMRVGDPLALELWLTEHDLREAVERLAGRPLILLHAEGDDQIPSYWSEELYERAARAAQAAAGPGRRPPLAPARPRAAGGGAALAGGADLSG